MPRWAIIVTAFYVVVVLALFTLTAAYIGNVGLTDTFAALFDLESIADTTWVAWLLILGFVAAEAMMLFVAVDGPERRPTPRRRLAFAVLSITAAVGALGTGLVWSLSAVVWGDNPPDSVLQIGTFLPYGLWLFWGIVFYVYREGLSARFDRAVSWLLNGSVLQFLIAVPCHIVVRQRDDCCAPVATGIGIATGVAVMLMAFGPSVVFLYQKRLRDYERRSGAQPVIYQWPVRKPAGALMLGAAALFVFLPLDDSWLLGVFVPTENVERLNAGVADAAMRLGLVVQPSDTGGLLLLCNGREVARALVSVAADGQSETWQIRLRADQRELMSALEDAVAAPAEDTWVSEGPPTIERWRARLIAGAFFGGACDR